MKHPYELRRNQFIPIELTYPIPTSGKKFEPKRTTESELHRATLAHRNSEITPALPQVFPLGTWAMDRDGGIWQLRQLPVADLRHSHDTHKHVVDKYVAWYEAGSTTFPPLYGVENRYRRISLTNGNHRLAAMKRLGLSEAFMWVNCSAYRELENGECWADEMTYARAVAEAIGQGIAVNRLVMDDAFGDMALYLQSLPPSAELGRSAIWNDLMEMERVGLVRTDSLDNIGRWFSVKITPLGEKVLEAILCAV